MIGLCVFSAAAFIFEISKRKKIILLPKKFRENDFINLERQNMKPISIFDDQEEPIEKKNN